MRTLRSILKSLGFLSLLGIGTMLWASGLLFSCWSDTWRWRWRCFVFRQWAGANALLLGMTIRGQAKAVEQPNAPVLLVVNHQSYLDVITLVTKIDAVLVAKSEVSTWPLLGPLSRWMGTIFIDRQRKRDILRVNALIESALRQGKSVILFPEGTTSDGTEVLPFKSPLLEPAIRLNIPVHYAGLHYVTPVQEPAASESVCWWGEMDFIPHLWRLFQLDQFAVTILFGDEPIAAANRKVLARQLHEAVTEAHAQACRNLLPVTESSFSVQTTGL